LISEAKRGFTEAADQGRLEAISTAMHDYQRTFKEMVLLRQTKAETRATWLQNGANAEAAVAAIELSLLGTPDEPILPYDEEEMRVALLASELSKQHRQLRYALRGYLIDEAQKSLDVLTAQFTSV